jgi:hypothetical protein
MYDKIKFELDILDVLRRHGYAGEWAPKRVHIDMNVREVPKVVIFYE